MITVLITEGKGTLELPNPSQDIRDLLVFLKENGLLHAVTTNSNGETALKDIQAAGLPEPDILVSGYDVGHRKPSPRLIERVLEATNSQRTQVVYLGDDDETDAFSAVNANILYLSASYSRETTPREYGLPVIYPKSVLQYLETFGRMPEPYFGKVFTQTTPDQAVDVRILIDQQRDLSNVLERVLKDDEQLVIGSNSIAVQSILLHYLLSSIYQSGLADMTDTFTVYPGSEVGKLNPFLSYASNIIARQFRRRFLGDLLVRHTTVPSSRSQGARRAIATQFGSIHVNPEYRKYVEGKRVLVLDDFTTWGYSFEAARQMLLKAGASSVTGVAVAKFRYSYHVSQVRKEWDPYAPSNFNADEIQCTEINGSSHPDVDAHFRDVIWSEYSR